MHVPSIICSHTHLKFLSSFDSFLFLFLIKCLTVSSQGTLLLFFLSPSSLPFSTPSHPSHTSNLSFIELYNVIVFLPLLPRLHLHFPIPPPFPTPPLPPPPFFLIFLNPLSSPLPPFLTHVALGYEGEPVRHPNGKARRNECR